MMGYETAGNSTMKVEAKTTLRFCNNRLYLLWDLIFTTISPPRGEIIEILLSLLLLLLEQQQYVGDDTAGTLIECTELPEKQNNNNNNNNNSRSRGNRQ
jgi:hypothetical protein